MISDVAFMVCCCGITLTCAAAMVNTLVPSSKATEGSLLIKNERQLSLPFTNATCCLFLIPEVQRASLGTIWIKVCVSTCSLTISSNSRCPACMILVNSEFSPNSRCGLIVVSSCAVNCVRGKSMDKICGLLLLMLASMSSGTHCENWYCVGATFCKMALARGDSGKSWCVVMALSLKLLIK